MRLDLYQEETAQIVGERLIPATLSILSEPYEEWPMRDRLNRLEKLLDVENWLNWRKQPNPIHLAR